MYQTLNPVSDHEGAYVFWLGGTDLGNEGSWIWLGSREPVPDFAFFDGQPSEGINANWMGWWPTRDGGGDDACDRTFYPLCQIPIELLI